MMRLNILNLLKKQRNTSGLQHKADQLNQLRDKCSRGQWSWVEASLQDKPRLRKALVEFMAKNGDIAWVSTLLRTFKRDKSLIKYAARGYVFGDVKEKIEEYLLTPVMLKPILLAYAEMGDTSDYFLDKICPRHLSAVVTRAARFAQHQLVKLLISSYADASTTECLDFSHAIETSKQGTYWRLIHAALRGYLLAENFVEVARYLNHGALVSVCLTTLENHCLLNNEAIMAISKHLKAPVSNALNARYRQMTIASSLQKPIAVRPTR